MGTADGYRDHFIATAKAYPRHWWIVCTADWELRMEWAITERRRLREFHVKVPMLSQYDESKPWNSVLLAAFRGTASLTYWKAKVDLRVKEFEEATSHRGKGIQADVLQLQGGGALGLAAGKVGQVQKAPGTGKRALKRAAAAAAANAAGGPGKFAKLQHQQQVNLANLGGGGGGAGGAGGASSGLEGREDWWNAQRPDGHYMYAENKKQLCYAWGRSPNGCTDPLCAAVPQRMHLCEWCRQPHRSIRCPAHPDWTPPPPTPPGGGKGRGRGRGKGGAKF